MGNKRKKIKIKNKKKKKGEKREGLTNKILSHNPSQTVRQEGKNHSVLMQSLVCTGCWPESVLRIYSFKSVFQQDLQHQGFQILLVEKQCSALSPSDALAENGRIHSRVYHSITRLYRAQLSSRETAIQILDSLQILTECLGDKDRRCINWKRQEQTSCGFPMSIFGHMQDLFISDLEKNLCQKGFCDYHLKMGG